MYRAHFESNLLIRVLVVANSFSHTQLLVDALNRDRDLEAFSSDAKLIVEAATAPNVDVLVISSNLDEQANRGYEVLRELHTLRPQLRSIVLLDSSKAEVILEAFRAGARGVFSRHQAIEKLCKCVHCVHQGQIWADSHQMTIALEALSSFPAIRAVDAKGLRLLSARETEIVQCLAEGLTNRGIADRLGLSQHTVKNYLFRVFDKVGVSNRVELLFMTLSQSSSFQTVLNSFLKNYNNGALQDVLALAECQQAAEQGVPMAQLALAQMLWTRKASSKDIVQAYKWYLIATGQIQQTSKTMSRAMTMEQLLHAEQLASDWLKKTPKIPVSSITQDRPPIMKLSAASG
jgi:DNA-binding NarL/FixJ family response regulator